MNKRKAPRGARKPQHLEAPAAPAAAAKLQQAMLSHRQGRLEAAAALYREILAQAPAHFDALHWLGVLSLQRGDAAASADLIGRAVDVNPRDATAHTGLGNALRALDRPAEALASYDRALALRPDYPEALANRGAALRDLQRHEDALASFDRALALRPAFAEAHYNRGNALRDLKRPEEALASYDRALALRPAFAEALANRGNALQDLKRYAEALASQERALALQPDLTEALFNRGNALRDLGRAEEAVASYDRALALRPAFAEALANRGNALQDLKRYEEALASHDRALALQPELAEALYNRGKALQELGRSERALADQERALAINPSYLEALTNRGNALMDLRRYEDALASFGRALELAPDYASARFNEGICRLLMGDLARGWQGYEWRWEHKDLSLKRGEYVQARWSGEYLDGVLLAWGEQGLGDQILHLGMLRDLTRLAKHVIVAVDARLVPLVRRSFPEVTAVGLDQPLDKLGCDAQVPLGSIAQYLRRSWEDFPAAGGRAYLVSDDERARALRAKIARQAMNEEAPPPRALPTSEGTSATISASVQRLPADRPLICGLSWISKSDRLGPHKTIALRDLEPVLGLPRTRFIDLQYGDTQEEREGLDAAVRHKLARIEEVDNTGDIDGLAALITACDVVATVSNTTAHLAGALGRPVLLMLPYSRGRIWYWHEDRDDSPWYPSLRLYRQSSRGDWAGVIERVRRALEQEGTGG